MLDLFFARLELVLATLGCEWEVVAVDDGSTDATVAGLLRHRQREPRIKFLSLKALPERNRFNKGLFAWVGFRQVAVPYAREARAAGQSSWRCWRLWNFALDGPIAFSSAPIRIWTYLGALAGVAAFGMAATIVVRTAVLGVDTPGYVSLACSCSAASACRCSPSACSANTSRVSSTRRSAARST